MFLQPSFEVRLKNIYFEENKRGFDAQSGPRKPRLCAYFRGPDFWLQYIWESVESQALALGSFDFYGETEGGLTFYPAFGLCLSCSSRGWLEASPFYHMYRSFPYYYGSDEYGPARFSPHYPPQLLRHLRAPSARDSLLFAKGLSWMGANIDWALDLTDARANVSRHDSLEWSIERDIVLRRYERWKEHEIDRLDNLKAAIAQGIIKPLKPGHY